MTLNDIRFLNNREKNIYKKLPKYLSLNEAKKVLKVYEDKENFIGLRNNEILHLFLCSGLRLSELADLKITDFNLKEKKELVLSISQFTKAMSENNLLENIIPIDKKFKVF